MKKTYLSLFVLFAALQFSYGQTNTFPSSGYVGIGTTSPTYPLTLTQAGETGILTNVSGTVVYLSHGGWGLGSGKFGIGNGYTPTLVVNAHANGATSVGNVGIGTTSPRAALDIATALSYGSLGSVLGRLPEGESTGAGTFLGVKAFDTQLGHGVTDIQNVKSFAIEHGFYGDINSSINFNRGVGILGGSISINTGSNVERIRITGDGNVAIGTTDPKGYKLAVNGAAVATSMKVKLNANWPDFVFLKDYKLPTLTEVKAFIHKNQHLPDVPSADEVRKNGLDLGEMNRLLLKKVEELTLYLIEKDTADREKEARLKSQQGQIDELKRQIEAIKK